MPKQVGRKNSKSCCDRLLLAHSAKLSVLCSLVIKYSVEAVLHCSPGGTVPPSASPRSCAPETNVAGDGWG